LVRQALGWVRDRFRLAKVKVTSGGNDRLHRSLVKLVQVRLGWVRLD
jgi:hypothetical protein